MKESQPVHHANRNIGRLVFGQHNFLVTIGDYCGTFNHNPVLGAVMVHLQRELCSGLNGNPLNLKTIAHINGVISTPWAINLPMQFGFRTVFLLQPVIVF